MKSIWLILTGFLVLSHMPLTAAKYYFPFRFQILMHDNIISSTGEETNIPRRFKMKFKELILMFMENYP